MIRGKDLNHGGDCIHWIWLTSDRSDGDVPARFGEFVASGRAVYLDRQHVFWGDSDAQELVERWGNGGFFYTVLRTPVERSDVLRMMILYDFGGIYADVDVEFKAPLPFVADKAVNLVKSPLFSEEFQSCLLVANTVNHPLWRDCVDRVEKNFEDIKTRKEGEVVRKLLENPITAYFARMALTVFLTGPPNIDRCIAASLDGYGGTIGVLPDSPHTAIHHEAGSWTVFPRVASAWGGVRAACDITFRVCSNFPTCLVILMLGWRAFQ